MTRMQSAGHSGTMSATRMNAVKKCGSHSLILRFRVPTVLRGCCRQRARGPAPQSPRSPPCPHRSATSPPRLEGCSRSARGSRLPPHPEREPPRVGKAERRMGGCGLFGIATMPRWRSHRRTTSAVLTPCASACTASTPNSSAPRRTDTETNRWPEQSRCVVSSHQLLQGRIVEVRARDR